MPTGILRRRAGVAVAVATVLMSGLSACSDPAQPATLPTTAATTTAAPTTSTPEPPTPEEEVERFVHGYYAELTRAAQQGDVSLLKTMSTKACPCYGYVKAIRQVVREGLSTPDAAWTVTSINVHDLAENIAAAEVSYEVAPYDVLESDGGVRERMEPDIGHVDLSLVRHDGKWIIGSSVNLEASA